MKHSTIILLVMMIMIVISPNVVIEGEVGRVYEETRTLTYDSINVYVTWYTSSVLECDDTPFITADGTHVRHGIMAISRDLFKYFNYGDSVFVQDHGWFEIHDCMNTCWINRIDIWCEDRGLAFENGIQRSEVLFNFNEEIGYVEREL
jgi:3D (Asp-Asp-Asp) domain-containing protein